MVSRKSHRKGKTYEEEYGVERAIYIKRKSSISHKGLPQNHQPNPKGSKNPEHSKRMKGRPSPRKGIILSEEIKKRMSIAKIGTKHTNKSKIKMKISAINRINKNKYNSFISVGKNEKQILDELSKNIGYKIIRQYFVKNYFIDGYIPELNLAIEVDEKYHIRKSERDIQRENIIKQKLNCVFIRIKDY